MGLPHGSASSSSLFNIYVNDLIKILKTTGNFRACMIADVLDYGQRHVASEFELYFDNTNLDNSDNTKYLSVPLDNKLSFLEPINLTKRNVEK
ncbi:hypothetical protein CEXT_164731 [Caerostris extrusa]|uniref:Uncharacterized protein n=1 Tax=Caerostris extrusa TaxID=172846 RepID=A0AAV4T8Y5_CAEEX|nr:hypothetical protein CEXT_164731 [Caerostris extrusa]